MMVLDSSVIVDLLVSPASLTPPDPHEEWWEPTTLDAEFVNVLLRHSRSGRLSGPVAQQCLDDFDALAIRRWQLDAPTRQRMPGLGQRLSADDAAYVTVAEALDAPLVTRDRRLAATAGSMVECVLL